MRFESPGWIHLLWLVPFMAALGVWYFRVRQRQMNLFAPKDLFARIAPWHQEGLHKVRFVFFLGVLLSMILALMRPQWGHHWEEVERKGVDIVIAIDLSDSMLAEDISPNRLARAKRKVTDLLRILEGDRIGLVAFSGVAFLQCPLTADYGAMSLFLDSLDTDLIPVKGTSLGNAIEVSLRAFDLAQSKAKAILLITDGEDLSAQAMTAAAEAKKRGVRLYTIGIGSEKGAPIPNRTGGDFRKSPSGELVFSKLDETTLRKLAETTGGAFVRSVSDDSDLITIYKQELRREIEAQGFKSSRIKRYEERFQWPLLGGVLLLIGELLLTTHRRRKLKVNGSLFALGFLLCAQSYRAEAASLLSPRFRAEQRYEKGKYAEAVPLFEEHVIEHPEDLEAQFNLASAYYKSCDYKRAEEAWRSAIANSSKIKDAEQRKRLEANSYYGQGNAAFQQQRFEDAVTAYKETLERNSKDEDAAYNMKLAEKKIEEQKEQKKQQENSNNKDKDKDKGDKQSSAQPSPTPGATGQQTPEPQAAKSEKMSKEEAERLLNQLAEEQKNAARKRVEEQTKGQRMENENDW